MASDMAVKIKALMAIYDLLLRNDSSDDVGEWVSATNPGQTVVIQGEDLERRESRLLRRHGTIFDRVGVFSARAAFRARVIRQNGAQDAAFGVLEAVRPIRIKIFF